jgi:phosphoadenosine phosphosulfate reductase
MCGSPASGDPVAREDSPVPSLRSSSSSFEDLDLQIDEGKPGTNFRLGLKWILSISVALAAIALKLHNFSRPTAPDADGEKLQVLYKLSLPANQQELITLNNELAGLDPKYILQWAHFHLHDGADAHERNSHPLVQATSFGPTGLVILDHLATHNLLEAIPVITMDTLHLFPESYVFYDTVQKHYGSDLHLTVTKPIHKTHCKIFSKEQFQDVFGAELWRNDHNMYTRLTKLDPMQQKLEEWGAVMWITGRRRSQGGERGKLDVLEFEPYTNIDSADVSSGNQYDPSRGRWKLNPLAYWSYDKVWSYIRENSVPYNTLYDKGYTSIGDEMTTSLPESKSSEHGERSGRFTGFGVSNKECGLHVDLDLDLPGMEVKDDDRIAK